MFQTIPEGHVAILERWGKFDRILDPGFHFVTPLIESVKDLKSWGNTANKYGYLIEMTEQQTHTPKRHCQTLDNVTIVASSSIAWRIVDPKKAVYEVDVLTRSISDIALNSLRSQIGSMKFDQVLSSRAKLNDQVLSDISEIVKKWGVQLLRVEIQELTYSEETAQAMMQEMVAERRKRALIAEAEGIRQSEVLKAEAQAQSLLIQADAKAKVREIESQGDCAYLSSLKEIIGLDKAVEVLKTKKIQEAIQVISKDPSSKIYLPNGIDRHLLTAV